MNRTWIWVTLAGLTATAALGLVMRGLSGPDTPDEVLSVDEPAPPEPGRMRPTDVPQGAFVQESSGLRWATLAEGEGAEANPGDEVVVEYAGWLPNDRLFDTTMGGRPKQVELGSGTLVEGLEVGIAGMREGGRRQLVVPPELGYGASGHRRVPPDTPLRYEVHLVEVHDAADAPAPTSAPTEVDEYTTTASGLKYHDLAAGTGPAPEAGDTMLIHYTGWLADSGDEFGTSRGRDPLPVPLGAGQITAGLEEGLATMKVGGERQLVVPPELAYGEKGSPPEIPPDATLVYEVELVGIE